MSRVWAQDAKNSGTDVIFYTVAHQDDWQLFMGSHAYDDVQRPHTKVVFIYVTAGQAFEPGNAYWNGREAGTRAAVISAADAKSAPSLPVQEVAQVNGHAITMMRYKNTVAYFLRLPDGNVQGQGFERCSYQSLKKLRNGESAITDLDGANTYASWAELSRTVRQLVQREVSTGRVWMNASDPNDKYNPGDHSDHQMAGRLGLGATANIESCQLLYVGYNIGTRKENLSQGQTTKQKAVFSAYCQGLTSSGQPTAWDAKHLGFMGRQYYRVQHSSGPSGPGRPMLSQATTGVEEQPAESVAKQLVLAPNYPNPFDQASLLVYDLPQNSFVTLRIYDLQGRVIKTLVQQDQTAGHHEQWLEVDQFPASGQYICQLQAGGEHREQRIQILR